MPRNRARPSDDGDFAPLRDNVGGPLVFDGRRDPGERQYLLERDVERRSCEWAERRGWFHRKYKGPGRRSHPDRLFIFRSLVIFVEFKRRGKEPTELQWKEHRKMRAHGADVVWVDDIEDFKAVILDRESRVLQRARALCGAVAP